MSYDVKVVNKKTNETVFLPERHYIGGGTFAIDGTDMAWLNITYNYSKYFYEVIDKDLGIRFLYGKTLQETMPMLDSAIDALGTEPPSDDYWKESAGNARRALESLREIAKLCIKAFPDDEMVWSGD